MGTRHNNFALVLRLIAAVLSLSATASAVGVNYGTLGNNLPTPATVAKFLKTKTIIESVKLFNADPDILRAFAGSGLKVTVTIPNGLIPSLTKDDTARGWINDHIAPFYPKTKINRVLVGNEIMATLDDNLISNLVPAMKAVHRALVKAGMDDVQVTTAHAMGILKVSEPPSAGQFWPGHDVAVYAPMLQFLRETDAPFMVNPYSYFGYSPKMANYSLFLPNPGIPDPATGITYTDMFDATLDATYSAMKRLNFTDVPLLVGETGWPTLCLPGQLECTVDNAACYNSHLVARDINGTGTPLVPDKPIGIFLFALFNENQKPGPITEQHWGLFKPDMTPVYDCGVVRPGEEIVASPESSPSSSPKEDQQANGNSGDEQAKGDSTDEQAKGDSTDEQGKGNSSTGSESETSTSNAAGLYPYSQFVIDFVSVMVVILGILGFDP